MFSDEELNTYKQKPTL